MKLTTVKSLAAAGALVLTVQTTSAAEAPGGVAGGGGSTQFCESGYFGWAKFPGFKTWMDNHYERVNRVWQTPGNNATWTVWCRITSSQAVIIRDADGTTDVRPDVVYLDDGTRMGFRTYSKSGGYTIDINHDGTIWKVHRR